MGLYGADHGGPDSQMTTQTVEECEYVYSVNEILEQSLTDHADEKEEDKFEDLHRSILVQRKIRVAC